MNRLQKPVLLLVNPASGKGNAVHLLKERVIPLFQSVDVKHEIIQTGTRCVVLDTVTDSKKSKNKTNFSTSSHLEQK